MPKAVTPVRPAQRNRWWDVQKKSRLLGISSYFFFLLATRMAGSGLIPTTGRVAVATSALPLGKPRKNTTEGGKQTSCVST